MKVLSLFVCLLVLSVSPLTASAAPLNLPFGKEKGISTYKREGKGDKYI